MICKQNCIHRKKKGKSIYCFLNNEKETLIPYKMDIKFGEKPTALNEFTDMKKAKKCMNN